MAVRRSRPKELRRAYDNCYSMQRPMPLVDDRAVNEMSQLSECRERMQILDEGPNSLIILEREISVN